MSRSNNHKSLQYPDHMTNDKIIRLNGLKHNCMLNNFIKKRLLNELFYYTLPVFEEFI